MTPGRMLEGAFEGGEGGERVNEKFPTRPAGFRTGTMFPVIGQYGACFWSELPLNKSSLFRI